MTESTLRPLWTGRVTNAKYPGGKKYARTDARYSVAPCGRAWVVVVSQDDPKTGAYMLRQPLAWFATEADADWLAAQLAGVGDVTLGDVPDTDARGRVRKGGQGGKRTKANAAQIDGLKNTLKRSGRNGD